MFLSNLWTETWIEGIGSSNGLHYVGVYFCLFDYYPELNCFKENDTLKYQNVNYSDCFYNTVGISEKFFKNNFELFPNPFSEFTILKFENPLQETFTLNVMNADGRTVVKYENISGNDIKIEREQLNNGIYFFQLMNENQ